MATFSNSYLFVYNSVQSLGWAIVFFRTLGSYGSTNSFNAAYPFAGELVCLLQVSAVLEVIHGAIGLVPSGALQPLMQWGGKTHFVLAIVHQIPEIQESPAVWVAFFCWSVGEVIRYSHYALNCISICPHSLTFVRYTAFILLYPSGLASEMWVMYHALPYIKQQNLYSEALKIFPFSYYNFVQVLLLVYPFLWLKLYLHLLKQRKSKLGKQRQHKTKKKI